MHLFAEVVVGLHAYVGFPLEVLLVKADFQARAQQVAILGLLVVGGVGDVVYYAVEVRVAHLCAVDVAWRLISVLVSFAQGEAYQLAHTIRAGDVQRQSVAQGPVVVVHVITIPFFRCLFIVVFPLVLIVLGNEGVSQAELYVFVHLVAQPGAHVGAARPVEPVESAVAGTGLHAQVVGQSLAHAHLGPHATCVVCSLQS